MDEPQEGDTPADVEAPLSAPPNEERFTVDTGLFRELGELLVGRDSTALVELIKNAYDADASSVTVIAENLSDPDAGVIVVADDGNGMTVDQFRQGFLRVASRLKSSGPRRSPVYERRFTGAKGIGRLAAHKLARNLTVETRALAEPVPHDDPHRAVRERLHATIDWDEVERHETLADVGDAITLKPQARSGAAAPGTTIRLDRLRRAWTARERTRFVREVTTFQPGRALREAIAPEYLPAPLLFDEPVERDAQVGAGFAVRLGGDFDVGEDYSVDVLNAANWVVEVEALADEVRYAVSPTRAYAKKQELDLSPVRATTSRTASGAALQARIFVRSGKTPEGLGDAYGVRVYMEGFRVLPYGEPGDDWLDIDRLYAVRGRGVPFLGDVDDDRVPGVTDADAGLVKPPLRNVFGGVFLTEGGAPALRMLVNREGFVPDETFLEIRDAVSNAVALQTRVSAALRPNRRVKPQTGPGDRGADAPSASPDDGSRDSPLQPDPLARALSQLDEMAEDPALDRHARMRVAEARTTVSHVREHVIDEQTMLRVLASLGTQTAAFVHEINAALGSLRSLRRTVAAMLEAPPDATAIISLSRRVEGLERTIERQSAYLVEIVSPDARRRRSRRRVAEHFDAAALLLADVADRDGISITNAIPPDLRTPPMYPAEVTSIFTNLLSNAIKAAGDGGAVRADGRRDNGHAAVTVQNTGVKVDLGGAEEWFRPYQSTTAVVDPSLGQGMGLGLTITRAMLGEYRGTIAFVGPEPEFSTAVEVRLPA